MKDPKIIPLSSITASFTPSFCDQLPGIYYKMKSDPSLFKFCSYGSLSLLGYQPTELLSENIFEKLIHADDLGRVRARINYKDGPSSLEYRIADRQGNFKWVHDDFVVSRSGREKVLEGHITEITDSKLRSQLLQQLKA